jgi:hypothetical protein
VRSTNNESNVERPTVAADVIWSFRAVNFGEIVSDVGCQNREGVFPLRIWIVFATSPFTTITEYTVMPYANKTVGQYARLKSLYRYNSKNIAGA